MTGFRHQLEGQPVGYVQFIDFVVASNQPHTVIDRQAWLGRKRPNGQTRLKITRADPTGRPINRSPRPRSIGL